MSYDGRPGWPNVTISMDQGAMPLLDLAVGSGPFDFDETQVTSLDLRRTP